MKNKAFILLSLLIIQGKLFSQRRILPDETSLALADCLTIGIDSAASAPLISRPLSAMIVADERFDRMKVGYLYVPQKNDLWKMCTKENVTTEITGFLNSCFSTDPSGMADSIYMYIKKLWIKNENPYKTRKDVNISGYSLKLRVEFYQKKQSCLYPLYRFDSTLLLEGTAERAPGILLRKGLMASIRKLDRENLSPAQPTCLSSRQVDSFNRASWNIPILKDGIARKGIYLTFNQFKNNRPAISDFDITFGEFDFLSVSGKEISDSLLRNAWGFSDGTTVFVRTKRKFFPLFRSGDNFEYYAYTKITKDRPNQFSPSHYGNTRDDIVGNLMGLMMATTVNTSSDIRLYTLDIETGKVY